MGVRGALKEKHMSTTLETLSGRVVGPGGEAVAGATVAMVGSTRPHRDIAAITTADGSFRFGGIAPGAYRVEARVSGRVGAADVVVAAGRPARVEIRIDG
jgi:hypothetical protein